MSSETYAIVWLRFVGTSTAQNIFLPCPCTAFSKVVLRYIYRSSICTSNKRTRFLEHILWPSVDLLEFRHQLYLVVWHQVRVPGLGLCPCHHFFQNIGGLEMANRFGADNLYWLKSSMLTVTASILWAKILRCCNLLNFVEQKPRQTLQYSSL